MMPITIGEIIGRYALTGVILWGALFVILVGRVVYLLVIKYDFMETTKSIDSYLDTIPDGTRFKNLLKFVLWPWGVLWMINAYMKMERMIVSKLKENS